MRSPQKACPYDTIRVRIAGRSPARARRRSVPRPARRKDFPRSAALGMLGAPSCSDGLRWLPRTRENLLRREEETHDREERAKWHQDCAGRWGRRSRNRHHRYGECGGRERRSTDFGLHLGWKGQAVADAPVRTLEGRRLEEASHPRLFGPPGPRIGGPLCLVCPGGGVPPALGREPSRRSPRAPRAGEEMFHQRSTHPGRPVSL